MSILIFAKVLGRLEKEASKRGYRTTVFVSKNKEEREEECIEMCKSARVAGVVLCSGCFGTEKFAGLDFPLITLERSIDQATSGIECDNYQGGVLATELLIEKGCKKLMYIGGRSAGEGIAMPGDYREVGFKDTCEKYHVEHLEMVTDKEQFDTLEYYSFVRNKLEKNPDVDGVFAGINVMTGTFSLIVKGRKIENGQETDAFCQVTIAGNFFDMLGQIQGIANDYISTYPDCASVIAPSVYVGELAVSGI